MLEVNIFRKKKIQKDVKKDEKKQETEMHSKWTINSDHHAVVIVSFSHRELKK